MDAWCQRAMDVLSTPAGYLGVGTAALVGLTTSAYLLSRPTPLDIDVDYDNQSVRMEDGSIASHWTAKNGKLIEYFFDDVRTVHESFLRGKRVAGDGKCLGTRTGPNRQYEWLSYNEVYARMQAFGSGLFALGVKPGQDTNFGIFSQNTPEWVIADQTCHMYSMVTVALYDTLGVQAVKYVVNLAEIGTVVCDKEERAGILLDSKSELSSLKLIVMIEEITDELKRRAQRAGVQIIRFSEVEELGKKNIREPMPPKPSDVCTICFTSGTTGNPKGVVLTHGNLVANVASFRIPMKDQMVWDPTTAHLSYLPLAHMYERICQVNMFTHGAHIGFFSHNILLLFDDLQTLKPIMFPTVPRLLNKIRDKVLASVEGSKVKSFLLNMALSRKLQEVRKQIIRKDSIWDKLVFRKIHAMLGGEVKFISTGSAPLSNEVFDFTRCALGCIVMEGYGQTECTTAVSGTFPGDPHTGHVGAPMACNYLKLIDVPEMEYYAKDGIGEVCVKGTNVMKGYYKNPEKTQEAFTSDGWLRTGDVGIIQENGTLKIVDRCKHIFKLSQGEYVAPERIEAIYQRSKYVQQCFIDGDSLKSRCVAIVVPEPDVSAIWATNNNKAKDIKTLCQDEDLKQVILDDIVQTGKKAGLKGFEQVFDIQLHPEPFSLESGLITPTFKNKRPQLRSYFAQNIASIYARHPELN